MVSYNQEGLVPVAPLHPRIMQAHEKVRDFQHRVRHSIGTQADRNAIYDQLEGWLHDLKCLTLVALRYREQHDFFNKAYNPFDESDECPAGAPSEQQFQYANNLVVTALRLEIETFHIYTSTLLDRIARIFTTYFGETKGIKADDHNAFWALAKKRTDVNYLTSELAAEAKWLQHHVDWFRNRVIVHPAGYEKEGFNIRGVKGRVGENVRTFARARIELDGQTKEIDKESETLEVIVDHLCRYVEALIDALDDNHTDSVLYDRTRPRPEMIN